MKTYRGTIRNGKVVIRGDAALPEGAQVELSIVNGKAVGKPRKPAKAAKPKSRKVSLAERLAAVVGKAKTLPPDASANHDHYLYGQPKRS